MISVKLQDYFSILLSVQYTYNKDIEYNYSNQPRPCHNFVFMLEGKGTLESKDKKIDLKYGDVLFIPKNTTYKIKWEASPKIVFQSLHFSFLANNDCLLNKTLPIQLLDNSNFDELYALSKEIELYQFSKNSNSFLTLSAFYKVCGKLFKNLEINKKSLINKTLLPAINFIQENYKKYTTVEELANLCNLSPSRFYYLFKRETGETPIGYKNRIAILNCTQELVLNKNITIKELARKYDFLSPIYFGRLFKKITGKTPFQYKKEFDLL